MYYLIFYWLLLVECLEKKNQLHSLKIKLQSTDRQLQCLFQGVQDCIQPSSIDGKCQNKIFKFIYIYHMCNVYLEKVILRYNLRYQCLYGWDGFTHPSPLKGMCHYKIFIGLNLSLRSLELNITKLQVDYSKEAIKSIHK